MADLGIIFLRRRYPIHWYQSSYIFITGNMPFRYFWATLYTVSVMCKNEALKKGILRCLDEVNILVHWSDTIPYWFPPVACIVGTNQENYWSLLIWWYSVIDILIVTLWQHKSVRNYSSIWTSLYDTASKAQHFLNLSKIQNVKQCL